MPYTYHLVDSNILVFKWTGPLTKDEFRQATLDRVTFAAEHIEGDYVAILDLLDSPMIEMDIRMAQWSGTVDPHMAMAIVVSHSLIPQVIIKLMRGLPMVKVKLDVVATHEQAMKSARHFLAARPSDEKRESTSSSS